MYVRVNLPALEAYIESPRGYPPEMSAQALLEQAYNALLAAKVVEWVDENERATGAPSGARLEMEDGELSFRSGEGKADRSWAPGRLPPWHGLIEALAYHLASTLNEPPIEGPWPKQFDQ